MGSDTPVSVAEGPNGQEIETYQQWNVQDWFDTPRWSLTGSQADSDFKAGLWWQDSKDLNNIVAPAMRTAADQWDAQYAKLDAAKAKLTSARTRLAGYTGKDAQELNRTLDNLTQSLDQRAEATEPISTALRNSASVIETSHAGPMTTLWNKWENDLANAPVCKVDVEQMTPVISDMAQSVLDATNAVQKGYETEIEPPEVGTPQPDTTKVVGPDSSTDAASGDDSSAASGQPATSTPGVVATGNSHQAATANSHATSVGSAPGTVVTPAGSGPSAASAVTGSGAGAVTGTSATGTHTAGPSLAGIGASTAAPTVPTAPAFAPGPVASGGAATLPPVLPAAGLGPAASTAGGSAAVGAPGFVPLGGAGARTGQQTRRDEDGRKRQGVVSPVVGGAGATRGARSAQIRPGNATRPAGNAGIAAGLLGRAAKDAESADIVASTRRPSARASRTASRYGSDKADGQDMFLDEDAWLTDDPGAGVVEAHQPHDPGAASAVIG